MPRTRSARALHADGKARAAYEAHLRLRQYVTNPPAKDRRDLRHLLEQLDRGERLEPMEGTAFFPSARSHETDLLRSFAGDRIPEGFDAAEEMVARIRRGQLDLQPGPMSGFYDYQVWALEPLLIPEKTAEARHLVFGHDYRHALEELFKGALALARETHIHDLADEQEEDEVEEDLVFPLAPRLSVEPLCTYYLRRAAGYRFLHDHLLGLLGREVLAGLARQTPEGPGSVPLGEELLQMAGLFMGAFLSASREIGADNDVPPAATSRGAWKSSACPRSSPWPCPKWPSSTSRSSSIARGFGHCATSTGARGESCGRWRAGRRQVSAPAPASTPTA